MSAPLFSPAGRSPVRSAGARFVDSRVIAVGDVLVIGQLSGPFTVSELRSYTHPTVPDMHSIAVAHDGRSIALGGLWELRPGERVAALST